PRPQHSGHAAYEIDVTLDDVAAEAIARTQRTFEVHARPLLPLTDRRSIEGRCHGRCGEPVIAMFTNGETRAVDRDALAIHQIVESRADAQLAPSIGLPNADDLPDFFD